MVRRACISLLFAVVLLQGCSAGRWATDGESNLKGPTPPTPAWPGSYEVSFTFTLPYVQSLQSGGLRYPVHVWYDGLSHKTRVDVYGGLDQIYSIPGLLYNIYPRIDVKVCSVTNSTTGPTAGLQDEAPAPPPLPDLSRWHYAGTARLHGSVDCYVWQLTVRNEEKTNTYSFYTTQGSNRPVKLYMLGVNLMTGSHFDEYIVDFHTYNPLPLSPSVFDPPKLCNSAGTGADTAHLTRAAALQLMSLLPSAAAAAALTSTSASSTAELASALQHQANLELINAWNAQHAAVKGFKLTANKFATWSDEQFAATSLGLRRPAAVVRSSSSNSTGALRQAPGGRWLGTYQRVLRDDELPDSVDYRGTGADGFVKDQASCGSCWAFATAGAMQGAWFQATGQSLSFSEQQIVDCAWDYGNNSGCGGGWVEPALDYIVAAGAAVQEEDYQYMGQNGFCKNFTTAGAVAAGRFRGYQNIPSRDEKALMEALHLHGPVAISMNAAHPTFKFYSEGVYHRDDCFMDVDHMDHAVLLVGYGMAKDGTNYWIIRNSWSKFWGEDGYARISRKGNDCGVSTDAVLAVVDPDSAAATKAARSAVRRRRTV